MHEQSDRLQSDLLETFTTTEREVYNLVKERTAEHQKDKAIPLYKFSDLMNEILAKRDRGGWDEKLLKFERDTQAAILRLLADNYFRMNINRTLETTQLL